MSFNNDITDFTEIDNNEPDIRETVFKYLRYWKWFVLSLLAFMVLGYTYIKLSTPQYKIETDLLIKDKDNKSGMDIAGQNDLMKGLGLFTSDKIIDNEIQILKSKTLLRKVVIELQLQTSYFDSKGVRKHEIYNAVPVNVELIKPSPGIDSSKAISVKILNQNEAEINGKTVKINSLVQTEQGLILITLRKDWKGAFNPLFEIKFNNLDDLVENYSKNLKIEAVSKQATILTITMEDAIPQRGIAFLNKLIVEYNQAALDDKNKVTSNTLSFINERIDGISGELSKVEKNVEQYKSSNRITDIGAESQIFLQSVGGNDLELNKVLIQLNVLNSLEKYLGDDNGNFAKLPSMMGIDDATLLGLVSQLGVSQLKKQSLLQTVPESNPLVRSYTDQINALKQAINASVQNLKKGLQITKQQLEVKKNQYENTIKNVPSKERGLLDVMRQQEIKNSLFTFLLQKREEVQMQLASGVADSRTIDMAWSSRKPIKPVKEMICILSFLLGIIIPAVIIYLKDMLNFKITRRGDIERFTKVPILAEISHSDEKDVLIVASNPRSMIAEQIRALRTNLQFILPNKDQKVILFTSSISGEGKSFVSLNLGSSLAMSGKKVVILELDLRKPKLHVGLNIDNQLGLSNYLIEKASYNDIVKEIKIQEGYYIITSGPIPPNPAELIGNGKIGALIELLKQQFDYIILDAPPVGLVTDAQILGSYADVTMFIVRHNYTAKSYIQAIDNLYKGKKFNHLNIILNSISLQHVYGYGYGYGYGYYQDDVSKKPNLFAKLLKFKGK
jgi:tyrosine-protein kinase Etk/Wzc